VAPKKRQQVAHPRLQRYLSECGVASRRSAEELIAAGKVTINGIVVTELGTRVDPDHSLVRVSNRIVTPAPKGVLLLHKPPGVISTLSDPEGRRSIADYMTKHYRSYFPVGRLDWDSAGLVVLTNDGDLANHLLHPKFEIERVYHARVEGIPSQKTLEILAKGVKLPDGPASCQAFILEVSGDHTWVEVTLSEGRNRIVRRIFDHVGHPVDKLKRISHGPFRLGALRPGDVRRLTEREYLRLKRIVETKYQRESERSSGVRSGSDERSFRKDKARPFHKSSERRAPRRSEEAAFSDERSDSRFFRKKPLERKRERDPRFDERITGEMPQKRRPMAQTPRRREVGERFEERRFGPGRGEARGEARGESVQRRERPFSGGRAFSSSKGGKQNFEKNGGIERRSNDRGGRFVKRDEKAPTFKASPFKERSRTASRPTVKNRGAKRR